MIRLHHMAAEQPQQLPQPGEVVHRDFRSPAEALLDSRQQQALQRPGKTLRLLTWNIERGYQLPRIIEQLKDADADVIALQEVDWGCERSSWADTGAAIAQALGLNYLFVCEFDELHSPLREPRTQGGGVHGNALLSKYDFRSWNVIEHSHHPIDWAAPASQQPHPLAAKEPRRGRRLTLAADVDTPQGPLRVYSCHLEVYCGILSRVWQFSDILVDARAHQQLQQQAPLQQQQQQEQQQHEQQQQQQQEQLSTPPQQQQQCHHAILGDLNTMGHSIARLSPNYCCDRLRWGSIGSSEAAWWQRHVLAVTDPSPVNKYLLQHGLPPAVAAAAVNPGFEDPFDARTDVTLDNQQYRLGPLHLMAGKLDWCLLRGCHVVQKAMGNSDYSASDHKWLCVAVQLL